MLPTEAFTDVVAFLRLFNLKSLVVTNAFCSSLAAGASTGIRWEEFSNLRFNISTSMIEIFVVSRDDNVLFRSRRVANLTFPNETATAEFADAAFPNCIFEEMELLSSSKQLMDTIGCVADSVIIKGALLLPGSMSVEDSVDAVRKFRKVKASLFMHFLLHAVCALKV